MPSKYLGMLLAAITLDGNNGLFPAAIAIVESECEHTWWWFLICLCDAFEEVGLDKVVLMSDQEKGFIDAVENLFS